MEISQPLVTIGICTYNRSHSLHQYSLSAIEKLTYPNYEVVIIDDCSTDQTQEILSQYQDKLKNLRILRNDKNGGLPYSRNRVLENAQGEIIVFTDDDVSLFSNCLDEIVKVYTEDPQVAFIWGCVYQCHHSHDRNKPTFGTGSLFSITRTVASFFRFDTNIRYFKTYGCEEQDFARRVQAEKLKIIKAETVKANHYEAPAKDRAWRGLGGDLNYLYEKVKKGSLLEYYKSIAVGIGYAYQRLTTQNISGNPDPNCHYKEAMYGFYQLVVLMKHRDFKTAGKYLFYILIDIPIRSKIRSRAETKQAYKFYEYCKNCIDEAASNGEVISTSDN